MSADWKRLSRQAGLRVEGDEIAVACGAERSHKVQVEDRDTDAFRIWSLVARRGDAPITAAIDAWKMNRYRELVGFKVVERGRVIGEAYVPKPGLTPDEWKLHVESLAHACDRLEYLWTGRDIW